MGPRSAALLLLAAPALLAAAAPQQAIDTLLGAAWVPVAVLAVLPFYLHLGGRLPLAGAWLFLLVAFLLPFAALLHPSADTLLASDLAPRLQVLLVGTAALIALIVSTLALVLVRPSDPVVHVAFESETDHRRLYR